MQIVLTTPVSVDNVAQVAAAAATGSLCDNSKRIASCPSKTSSERADSGGGTIDWFQFIPTNQPQE
jgi:uncharacterized membrane protein